MDWEMSITLDFHSFTSINLHLRVGGGVDPNVCGLTPTTEHRDRKDNFC